MTQCSYCCQRNGHHPDCPALVLTPAPRTCSGRSETYYDQSLQAQVTSYKTGPAGTVLKEVPRERLQ